MAEFTGERVVPGKVDADLMNEHLARYAFAARLARMKRVLDAGCGSGYGSAELAKLALRVVGADQSSEAVGFARENYRLPNLCFEQASCCALPHPNASFDLVIAFEVIEHIGSWREFLLEVRRVLTPGRAVRGFHAEQALLCRARGGWPVRIRFTNTNSNLPNSATN